MSYKKARSEEIEVKRSCRSCVFLFMGMVVLFSLIFITGWTTDFISNKHLGEHLAMIVIGASLSWLVIDGVRKVPK